MEMLFRHAVSFPGIGIEEFEINRIAFRIPIIDWPVYWYGVIIAAGFLLAIVYILKRSRTFGLDADRVLDVLIGGVIGGIIGARLYYVLFSWETYAADPISIFYLWEGGLAIYGGVIGGFIAGGILCKFRRVRFLPMADLAVGGLILGQSIGRWGNFVNIEAFGCNTAAPWGMAGPAVARYLTDHQAALAAAGVTVDPSMPVHPTFFYESIWCLAGFLLIAFFTNHRRFDGELTLIYAAWYGLGRAMIEGLRTDSLMWGNMRVSQVLAAVLTVAAAVVLIYIRAKIKRRKDPEFLKLYVDTAEGQSVLEGSFYKKTEPTASVENIDEEHPSGDTGKTDAEPETANAAVDETEPSKGEDNDDESNYN